MDFRNNIPEWSNIGTEPSDTFKSNGFLAGYKPPAAIFNWFWHLVLSAIKELQTLLSSHTHIMPSKPEDVGAAPIGLCQEIYTAANEEEDLSKLNDILETMGDGENGGKAVAYVICKRGYSVDQTPLHSWLYRIESANHDYARVEATTSLSEGCKMQRVRINGEWLPWEHVNAPIVAGQEYRTAERWLGKPVYTKLVEYTANSNIGNANSSFGFSVSFSTPNFKNLIRYCGTIEGAGRAIPCFYNPEEGGGYIGINFMNHQGVAVEMNKVTLTAGTKLAIQVWYTKQ